MQKIKINIPIDYKYYAKKLRLLIINVKNIIIILAIIYLLSTSFIEKNKNNKMKKKYSTKENNSGEGNKVCICTLGKNENRYIKEFINHYVKLGVDKIFLHDNNEIGRKNEKFDILIVSDILIVIFYFMTRDL